MDSALLQRELGLPVLLRGGRRVPPALWGSQASEVLVRKLQLQSQLDQQALSTAVNDVSWDCSGSFLASAGDDCVLHVYSATGRLLRSFDPGHTSSIMALQYVPGSRGALLLTGGGDRQVRVINVERGAVKPFSCHEARVRCLAAVDGSVILSGADDGGVRLFDLRQSQAATSALQERQSLIVDQRAELPGRFGRVLVNSISVDPMQPHCFATGGTDPVVRIYDMRKLPRPNQLPGYPFGGPQPPPWVSCLVPEHLRGLAIQPMLASPLTSNRSHAVTGVAFDGTGRQLLASYSSESVYCFGVKDNGRTYDHLRAAAAAKRSGSEGAAVPSARGRGPAADAAAPSGSGAHAVQGGRGGSSRRPPASPRPAAAGAQPSGRPPRLRAVRSGRGGVSTAGRGPGQAAQQPSPAPQQGPLQPSIEPGSDGAPSMLVLPGFLGGPGVRMPLPQLPNLPSGAVTNVSINIVDSTGAVHSHRFTLPPMTQAGGAGGGRGARGRGRGRGRGGGRGRGASRGTGAAASRGRRGPTRSAPAAAAADGSGGGGGGGGGAGATGMMMGTALMGGLGGGLGGGMGGLLQNFGAAIAQVLGNLTSGGGGRQPEQAAQAQHGGARQQQQRAPAPTAQGAPRPGPQGQGQQQQQQQQQPRQQQAVDDPFAMLMRGLSTVTGAGEPLGGGVPLLGLPPMGLTRQGGGAGGGGGAIRFVPLATLSIPMGVPPSPGGGAGASAGPRTAAAAAAPGTGHGGDGGSHSSSDDELPPLIDPTQRLGALLQQAQARQRAATEEQRAQSRERREALMALLRRGRGGTSGADAGEGPSGAGPSGAGPSGLGARAGPRPGAGQHRQPTLRPSDGGSEEEGRGGGAAAARPAKRRRVQVAADSDSEEGQPPRVLHPKERPPPSAERARRARSEDVPGGEEEGREAPEEAPPARRSRRRAAQQQGGRGAEGAGPAVHEDLGEIPVARRTRTAAAAAAPAPQPRGGGARGRGRGRAQPDVGADGSEAALPAVPAAAASPADPPRRQSARQAARRAAGAAVEAAPEAAAPTAPPACGPSPGPSRKRPAPGAAPAPPVVARSQRGRRAAPAGYYDSSDSDSGSDSSRDGDAAGGLPFPGDPAGGAPLFGRLGALLSDSEDEEDGAGLPGTAEWDFGAGRLPRGPRSGRRRARAPSAAVGAPAPEGAGYLFSCRGHRNQVTLKNVAWLAPGGSAGGAGGREAFVVSGSDDGSLFVWSGKDGRLVNVVEGGDRPVNCVKAHPFDPCLASCGMDPVVRIWSPGCQPPTDLAHAAGIVHGNDVAAAAVDALARARGAAGLGLGGGLSLDQLLGQGLAVAFDMLSGIIREGGGMGDDASL